MKFIRLIYYYLIKRNSNKFNYYSKYNDAKKDVRKGKNYILFKRQI